MVTMRNQANVALIIPGPDEREAVAQVLSAIPRWVDDGIGVVGAATKVLLTIVRAAFGAWPARPHCQENERLIIFTRYPAPGKVKSRLIPTLGAQGAADLQRLMTEHIVRRSRALQQCREVALGVRYDGATQRLMRRWLGKDLSYEAQGPGSLGDRMLSAFAETFETGAASAIIVGSDCPELNGDVIAEAFESLKACDLVLGPATDGGYYLIGLRRHCPPVLGDIAWGTEWVLEQTLRIAKEYGLTTKLLKPLHDVDRPEDISVWKRECLREAGFPGALKHGERLPSEQGKPNWGHGLAATPTCVSVPLQTSVHSSPTRPIDRISVIMPTLNEVLRIGRTLASIHVCEGIEVLVVDGGSVDGTPELARFLGATVLTVPRGRAAQMNMGAESASGEILLFLHADTLLPEGWVDHVKSCLQTPATATGAFELRLGQTFPWSRLVEKLANFRSRVLQMPYGDQALFMKAHTFQRAGQFPELPIMEDFEFVRRLRKEGNIRIVPVAAVTSARRWQKLGVLQTTFMNQMIILAYLVGVSPALLARLYDPFRALPTRPDTDAGDRAG